ncbi:MAG: radical SAM protein [Bacteroidaceae bacterium]|nr:radical SAM protein [Bacteroidaceae bacterium]
MSSNHNIRLFDICREGTHVLGPGLRYVLWTQGCHRRCKGCVTPESQPLDGGMDIDIEALAADIVDNSRIDGLTVSGGEPFLQTGQLNRLLELVHQYRPELTVIVYTGYTMEQLEHIPHATEALQYVDVLIDGEYVEELNDNKGIRGSSNQRIIALSHRLDKYLAQMADGIRKIEYVAQDASTMTSIGVPHKAIN